MGAPKAPKAAPIAAAPKQSALEIKTSQNEAAMELRRRRGAQQSTFAGESGFNGALMQAITSLG